MLIIRKATVYTLTESQLKQNKEQLITCTQDHIKPEYNRNSSGNLTASIKF